MKILLAMVKQSVEKKRNEATDWFNWNIVRAWSIHIRRKLAGDCVSVVAAIHSERGESVNLIFFLLLFFIWVYTPSKKTNESDILYVCA